VKRPPPTERQVQRAILATARRLFPSAVVAHIPNGAHLAGTAGPLLGDGMLPGFPDLIVIWNYGVGFLEVKRPRLGKLTDAQTAMHALLRDRGQRVEVVTSADEAAQHLSAWGVPSVGEPAA
jgi:hypothetical protein